MLQGHAMFRPGDMHVTRSADARSVPAVVHERHNLGWTIKYTLRCDDGVVG